MIRNHNDIVIKIYYNGNEISKVFQKQIQVYPDQKFSDIFWLKVNDISDNKTYYYLCKKTNVVYDSEDTEKISEITYETTTKQETEPGSNQQIFELLNDDVEITGQTYEKNDFESFEGKTPNEVLAMTQTYQEKLLYQKKPTSGCEIDNVSYISNTQLYKEYTIDNFETILKRHDNLESSDFTGNVYDMTYMADWYKPSEANTNTTQGFFSITNIGTTVQKIKYIMYSYWNLAQAFITTKYEDIYEATKTTTNNIYSLKNLTGLVANYGGYSTWTSGYTNNSFEKKIHSISIEPKQTLYFFGLWYSYLTDEATDTNIPYWYMEITLMVFYNKSITQNIIFNGNILNHKYISDEILEKQIKNIKYNWAYAMVKNDLSNVVYQTNCKYILSKEELEKIEVNYALVIPTESLGWKLIERDEWLRYMPYNSDYKMSLTVANFAYTGEEFFGLLDKSNDYGNDFRIFGYGSLYIYMDPGSRRWQFIREIDNTTNITFTMNGMNNEFNAYENSTAYGPWTNTNTDGGFPSNTTTLYLNAYKSESNLTVESFTFYEFKIEDKDGNLVKRIVPSDDPKRLYETVSMTYIEPCRTVDDASLPTLIDNIKLGVEPVDGLGNKIENWYI